MGEILRRMGGHARSVEFFNKEFIARQIEFVPEKGAPVRSYIQYLTNKRSLRGVLGIKILYSQIEMFLKYSDFATALAGHRMVYLYRSDVIKQGISYFIATRTQQWTSAPSRPAAVDISEVEYSFSGISEAVSRMELHNSLLRRFLLVNELEYLPICYEEFLGNPTSSAERVMQYLGLELGDGEAISTQSFESQTTTKNREFYSRFVSDERLRYFGDGSYIGGPLFTERFKLPTDR
jgi:LPS sulfotransferase NodH